MSATFPLRWPDGWPRTEPGRRANNGPFKTSFDKARRELYWELERLGAENVVISSNVPLRLDGQPRGDVGMMRVDDPGVALYFTLKRRPMAMARDVYWRVYDNLRSLGLAIEHLRGLERHGGGIMMERAFSGFAALPPPSAARPWWQVLEFAEPPSSLDIAEQAYRRLTGTHHPDRGGSHERMAELNAAIAAARAALPS